MKTKLCLALGLALLAFVASPAVARANPPAPVGTWKEPGGSFVLVASPNGTGGYLYGGIVRCAGTWSWRPTGARGGILTVHYWNAGFRNNLYFGITYVDRDTIICNPGAPVTLRRQ